MAWAGGFIPEAPVNAARADEAGDDSAAVFAAWEGFRDALRRGDYPGAHARFTPASRRVYPYGVFIRDYHPATALCGVLLGRLADARLAVDGDWADLMFAAQDGGGARIAVMFAREDGVWRLVAAKREAAERIEAQLRRALRQAARMENDNPSRAVARLREWAARRPKSALAAYDFEVAADGTGNPAPCAKPRRPGLRSFIWNRARGEASDPEADPQDKPFPRAPSPMALPDTSATRPSTPALTPASAPAPATTPRKASPSVVEPSPTPSGPRPPAEAPGRLPGAVDAASPFSAPAPMAMPAGMSWGTVPPPPQSSPFPSASPFPAAPTRTRTPTPTPAKGPRVATVERLEPGTSAMAAPTPSPAASVADASENATWSAVLDALNLDAADLPGAVPAPATRRRLPTFSAGDMGADAGAGAPPPSALSSAPMPSPRHSSPPVPQDPGTPSVPAPVAPALASPSPSTPMATPPRQLAPGEALPECIGAPPLPAAPAPARLSVTVRPRSEL